MRRPVALLAFLALSWSQLAALRCDMGAGGHAGTHHEAMSAETAHHAPTPAHHAPAGQTASVPAEAGHGGDHGCLMVLACGTASIRGTRPVAMIREPALFVRATFLPRPVPAAADLAVETPPPRHSV
ncbi:MAG: hypothetical protein OXE96_00060 [Gemmatimonadetes bacterium]|nr:hypothetical protein [Gemmatimonadota bacterium]